MVKKLLVFLLMAGMGYGKDFGFLPVTSTTSTSPSVPDPFRQITVSATDNNVANGDALIAAVELAKTLNPSAEAPVTIVLESGTYDIQGNVITLDHSGMNIRGAVSCKPTMIGNVVVAGASITGVSAIPSGDNPSVVICGTNRPYYDGLDWIGVNGVDSTVPYNSMKYVAFDVGAAFASSNTIEGCTTIGTVGAINETGGGGYSYFLNCSLSRISRGEFVSFSGTLIGTFENCYLPNVSVPGGNVQATFINSTILSAIAEGGSLISFTAKACSFAVQIGLNANQNYTMSDCYLLNTVDLEGVYGGPVSFERCYGVLFGVEVPGNVGMFACRGVSLSLTNSTAKIAYCCTTNFISIPNQ